MDQIYQFLSNSPEPIASLINSKFRTHVKQIAVTAPAPTGRCKGGKGLRAGTRERGTERAETQCELANSLREGQMANG